MPQLVIIHVYVELICFIFLVTSLAVLFIVLELPHTTVHQAPFASELQKSSIKAMNSMEVCWLFCFILVSFFDKNIALWFLGDVGACQHVQVH